MLRLLTGVLLGIVTQDGSSGRLDGGLVDGFLDDFSGNVVLGPLLDPPLETGIIPGEKVAISARSCDTPPGLCGECSSQRGSPVPGPHGFLGHAPFSIAVCTASARATVPLIGDG